MGRARGREMGLESAIRTSKRLSEPAEAGRLELAAFSASEGNHSGGPMRLSLV